MNTPDSENEADTPDAGAGEFLWAEARRLLDHQIAELDTLRGRAATLLAAAGITAGLFAGRVGDSPAALMWSKVAVGLFVLQVIAIGYIQLPRSFRFSRNLKAYGDKLWKDDPPLEVRRISWNWVRDAPNILDENKKKFGPMYKALTFALVVFGLQVVAWAVASLA